MRRIVSNHSSTSSSFLFNADTRADFVAMIGEFIGTTMFLFFAFAGTQVANIGAGPTTATSNQFSPIVLLYISVSFGFSLVSPNWVLCGRHATNMGERLSMCGCFSAFQEVSKSFFLEFSETC